MKTNKGFSYLVSYVDIDLKDKLTAEEQEEIYHLLLVACNNARNSGVANCDQDPIDANSPLEPEEKWLDRLVNYWDSKIAPSNKG